MMHEKPKMCVFAKFLQCDFILYEVDSRSPPNKRKVGAAERQRIPEPAEPSERYQAKREQLRNRRTNGTGRTRTDQSQRQRDSPKRNNWTRCAQIRGTGSS